MPVKTIDLSIASPCSEDFNSMTPTARGAHCSSCRKEVIDFTAWSDEQLIGFFNSGGSVCGRLRDDQLGRSLVPASPVGRTREPRNPPPLMLRRTGTNGGVGWLGTFILSMFVLLSRPVSAQTEKEHVRTEQVVNDTVREISRPEALKSFSAQRTLVSTAPVTMAKRANRTMVELLMGRVGCVSVVTTVKKEIPWWRMRVDEMLR